MSNFNPEAPPPFTFSSSRERARLDLEAIINLFLPELSLIVLTPRTCGQCANGRPSPSSRSPSSPGTSEMKKQVANQPRSCSWDLYLPFSTQVAVCGLLVPLLLLSSHIYQTLVLMLNMEIRRVWRWLGKNSAQLRWYSCNPPTMPSPE